MMTGDAFFALFDKYRSTGEEPFLDSERYSRISHHPALEKFLRGGERPDSFDAFLDFTDLDGFLDVFALTSCYLRDEEDIELLAKSAIEQLVAQNVAYAEIDILFGGHKILRYSPQSLGSVLDQIAEEAPIHVQWLAGIPRFQGPEESERTVRELIAANIKSLAGIQMGGAEAQFPNAEHARAYQLAGEAGLRLSCHAGEAAGPESVWAAINDLGVDRIGHGVRSIEDPRLVGYLVEEGIPLEICPTSNIFTGIYRDLAHHPIRELFDAGVPVTLNSDDPSFFGADLVDEYIKLHSIGWSEDDLLELVENGFAAAFLDVAEIEAHLDAVQQFIDDHRRTTEEEGEDEGTEPAISVSSAPSVAPGAPDIAPAVPSPEPARSDHPRGSIPDLLTRVPKAELHIHLGGAMTADTFVRLFEKHQQWSADLVSDWDAEAMARYPVLNRILNGELSAFRTPELFQFTDMDQFAITQRLLNSFVRDADDIVLLAQEAFNNLVRQNVIYTEMAFDLVRFSQAGLSMAELASTLEDIAAVAPLEVKWLADPSRDHGPDRALELTRELIAHQFDSLAGVTLSGRERDFPLRQFRDVFEAARDAGLGTTSHAGELLGPDAVWDAADELELDRIGHGIAAAQDQELIKYLSENAIPLEICPTANVATGIFPTIAAHPIHELFDAGVTITLATDNPTFFGVDLLGEYLELHETGWTKTDLLELVENGFLTSFLEQDAADRYVDRVHAIWPEE